ncbi:MAG: TAT-variant-translocated molybdopterin oxidoreductase [Verrucomicrobia bacterium]|nr:TAT-variant-translocated molybdopterin oxidoreductase [Verrucomicrobiota bacterium]
MKTIPPPCPEPDTGPKYWRSLDQLADAPEFRQWLEREFPDGASEFTDPVSRRYFVKIMSASFLLGGLGLTGCRRPVEHILPFSKMPENYTHGVAQFYATAFPTRSSAIPLVVKSHDGRPIKIEGNADHPDSNGATDQFAQASILDLYDPDRAKRFTRDENATTREDAADFLAKISEQAKSNGGQGLRFLLQRSSSPSRSRLQKLISEKFPNAQWHVYEPVDFDIHRQAASLAFGKPVSPYYKLDEANVIVSLDCDFIGGEEDTHIHVRRFAKRRNPEKSAKPMNRLYAVEGLFTLTGANADHRLRVPTSAVQGFAARLALEILRQKASGSGELQNSLSKLAAGFSGNDPWVAECAKDLLAPGNAGKTLIVAGHRQPLAAHLIAWAVNAALGNVGSTVAIHEATDAGGGDLAALVQALNAGQVETLVILGGNPAYDAPSDLKWTEAQAKARTVVRLGYHEDETFPAKGWHLPLTHYLESWGDARTADGTVVPIQPLIEPLSGGITALEVLARVGGLAQTNAYDIVRETFRSLGGEGENAWRKFLHDGFLAGSAAKTAAAQIDLSTVAKFLQTTQPPPAPTKDKLEAVFHRSYSVDDGRFNNNGWLQETPDPITKLTWDNAILISPKTAAELGVGDFDETRKGPRVKKGLFKNQVVEVELNGRKLRGPIWILPGLADNILGLALGYGRKKTGRIGRLPTGAPAGYNAYELRTTAGEHFSIGAKVIPLNEIYDLASTQEHGAMEGRPLIREATKQQYEAHPDFAKNMDLDAPSHVQHILKDPKTGQINSQPPMMYKHPYRVYEEKQQRTGGRLKGPPLKSDLHQWGMSIDLTACVGCSACMVACQSENNVPIVGKDQVTKGREMAWIRLDRYFVGNLYDPQIAYQPMLCQHCENAPCESVCPVNATVHDEEGLNLMVYNRCVGTRFCSNNCPYKVRRFNYFDYSRRPIGPGLYKDPFTSRTDGEWELKRWFKDPDKGSVPPDEWDLGKLVRNPDVTVRMRGVMEKCTFCVQRLEQAKIAQKVKAGASGDVRVPEGTIKTACQQACPAEAIVFGNLADPNSQVSQLKKQQRDYSVLGFLDTRPRTTYLARIRNPNPNMPDPYKDSPAALKEYVEHGNADPMGSHGAGRGGGHDPASASSHKTEKGAH